MMTRLNMPSTLVVIAPCFNEEEVIDLFYEELVSVLEGLNDLQWGIIFVDDGSTDKTLKRLDNIASLDARVSVLSLSRNFGHQAALTAGLDHADADMVVLMDSDLQHPPALIVEMVKLRRQGNDVVSAVRTHTASASFLKRKSSSIFYMVFNLLSDVKLVPGAADFCLLSRSAVAGLKSMPERHRMLRAMISWMGFQRVQVPYEAPPRVRGTSKYNASRMIRFAIDGVFSFTATPIRIASRLGVLSIFVGSVYFAVILYSALVRGDTVRGWGSIVSLILGLGGLQLLCIGLIGEYLARVYEEAKKRPLYFFKHIRLGRDTPGGLQERSTAAQRMASAR